MSKSVKPIFISKCKEIFLSTASFISKGKLVSLKVFPLMHLNTPSFHWQCHVNPGRWLCLPCIGSSVSVPLLSGATGQADSCLERDLVGPNRTLLGVLWVSAWMWILIQPVISQTFPVRKDTFTPIDCRLHLQRPQRLLWHAIPESIINLKTKAITVERVQTQILLNVWVIHWWETVTERVETCFSWIVIKLILWATVVRLAWIEFRLIRMVLLLFCFSYSSADFQWL